MTAGRDERLAELFERAAALPPQEREPFLKSACDDELLRSDVLELLRHDEAAPPGFLAGAPARQAQHAGPPQTIGRYRIVRTIGVGGMGIVYEAEQDAPRRRVALKVIRPDFASPAALHRFRREAEILGQLQHPGIAQIYEAGVVGSALGEQPYFAMELIDGASIDQYARQNGLDARGRLALIALVCDAVQHAHDRGVIHRDLKPANILVVRTESGARPGAQADRVEGAAAAQPKILDFGVARFIVSDVGAAATRTEPGQIIGTLSYMSPEQVRGQPGAIDGRADVYALGVILYELLSGSLPLDLEGCALAEAVHRIGEQEPSRLASRASEFRGDIDTIVGKAIEKDPARRYASPGALAADIRRTLRDEPITARPASTLYQLRKFARRNRALVGGAGATFLALVVGLILSVHFGLEALAERNAAETEALRAQRTAYRACLVAASAALAAENVLAARRQLEAAPADLRGWEWRHLWSRLDESQPAPALFPSAQVAARLVSHAPMPAEQSSYGCYEIDPGYANEGWIEYNARTIHFRDIATGRSRQASIAHLHDLVMPPVGPADLSVEGRVAAFTTGSGDLVLVEAHGSAPASQRVLTDARRVDWVRFSPDGRRLAVARSPGDVEVFDVETGTLQCAISGRSVEFSCSAFTADGQRVILGRRNGPISLWDANDGRLLATAPLQPDHTHWLMVSPVPRPDLGGFVVVSCSASGIMRLWNAESMEPLGVLRGHTTPAVCWFSADALTLLSYPTDLLTSDDRRMWDLRSLEPDVLRGHQGYVYPVVASLDGARLYSGGWDGYFGAEQSLRAWDSATGSPVEMWSSPGWQWISALACGPDGVVVAGSDAAGGRVRAYTADGAVQADLAVPDPMLDIALHPGGELLAIMPSGTVRNLAMGNEVTRLEGAGGRGVAFSPDGAQLASAAADHSIALRDTPTWLPRTVLTGHAAEITCLRYSPGGRLLASASEDGTVRIWKAQAPRAHAEVSSGESAAALAMLPHTDGVLAIAWRPGGDRLATAGRGGVIRIWDTATWEELTQLTGHSAYIYSLTFTPGGDCLASASGDHTVRLWHTGRDAGGAAR